MKLDFEYGQGSVSAELPEDTEVFIPGITCLLYTSVLLWKLCLNKSRQHKIARLMVCLAQR